MKRITRKISSRQDYVILLSAILISFYLLFFVNEPRRLGVLQRLSLEVIGRLSEPMASIRQLLFLREANERLRYQNAMLQINNARMAESYYENIRLRRMLNFRQETEWPLLAAKVIGITGKRGFSNMTINVGADAGVREDMTVVSADGLVGRIISVSPHYAVVQTILDAEFRAAAMIQRSRVQGIFQWAGYDLGTMKGVYLTADVNVGDIVVTSGVNSMFVAGLKIGTVSYVDDAPSGLFKKIDVKPKINISKLEEVFVINRLPEKITAMP